MRQDSGKKGGSAEKESKEEAEKELEESEITEERPPEKKKGEYARWLMKFVPGAVPSLAAVLLFANNHFIWGFVFVLLTLVLILVYDEGFSGTFVYIFAAGYYIFWKLDWFAFTALIIIYALCWAVNFIRYY